MALRAWDGRRQLTRELSVAPVQTWRIETERQDSATVVVIVPLQLYEDIAATYNLQPATRIQQIGVGSLLPYLDSSAGRTI